jgi:hypothetical protein
MPRYKKNYSIDGWPVEDISHGVVLHTDDLVRRLNEYEDLLREADEYLETNNLTNIGHGSILHKKFKAQTAV